MMMRTWAINLQEKDLDICKKAKKNRPLLLRAFQRRRGLGKGGYKVFR